MTTHDDIAKRVRQVVADALCIDMARVIDSASFIDDLDADSLDIVSVSMVIEDSFAMAISDAELETIKTIGDMVRLVRERIAS